MPQECITVKYCRKNGIGTLLERTHHLPGILREWMRQPEKLEAVTSAMESIRPKCTPIEILARLRSLIE